MQKEREAENAGNTKRNKLVSLSPLALGGRRERPWDPNFGLSVFLHHQKPLFLNNSNPILYTTLALVL